jgi:hypothetical protein
MMDKHEVWKALVENLLNLPWIDEIDSHEGFPEFVDFKEHEGKSIGYGWSMGDCDSDDESFIDIEVNMEHAKAAYEWYINLPLSMDEEDENGETMWISYDESEKIAEMRNDDVNEEGYEYPCDHIEICVRSQTQLRWLAEACIEINKDK